MFSGFSISLVYQFVHTERGGTSWRPIELVFDTSSHHRVHHGRDPEYLDRNDGGILVVRDRLFGSFQAERSRLLLEHGRARSWQPSAATGAGCAEVP